MPISPPWAYRSLMAKRFLLRNKLWIISFLASILLFGVMLPIILVGKKPIFHKAHKDIKVREIGRVKGGKAPITVVQLPKASLERNIPAHFDKFLKDAGLYAKGLEDTDPKLATSLAQTIQSDISSLNFITIISDEIGDTIMDQLRALIGGLHRLRIYGHKVPRFFIFTTQTVKANYLEEISMWSMVEVYNIQMFLGLPLVETFRLQDYVNAEVVRRILLNRVIQMWNHAIWVRLGYTFEPLRDELKSVEKSEDVEEILRSHDKARKYILQLGEILERDGYLAVKPLEDSKFLAIEGYSHAHTEGFKLLQEQLDCFYAKSNCHTHPLSRMEFRIGSEFGLIPVDTKSESMCYLDIKEDSILNQIVSDQLDHTELSKAMLEKFKDPKRKKIAIAMPTTSRNLKPGQELVFMKTFLPSLFQTVSKEEFDKFNIIIYLGFDHDDPHLDPAKERTTVKKMITELIGERPVQVKFIRFPNTRRVGMLWSMLFVRAMKEGCEYFYQVNDDLTLVTPHWLTNFTTTLDNNGGFGVVGPADNHNGFNCSILTQAMVTRTHYDIFTMFYPTDLKDWKTDRWLSHVYGADNTFCSHAIIANNGGAPTRYRHCIFLSWKIYLEAGKKRIAEWLLSHKVEKKGKLVS